MQEVTRHRSQFKTPYRNELHRENEIPSKTGEDFAISRSLRTDMIAVARSYLMCM